MPETRAIFPLLRARVIDRGANYFVIGFGPDHGSPTRIRIDCQMAMYDIRDGDILTLYTEVLLAKPNGAS